MEEIYHQLEQLKQQMILLASDPLRSEYERLSLLFQQEYNQLQAQHQQEKAKRQTQRRLLQYDTEKLKELDRISQTEKKARKKLKQQWQQILHPLEFQILGLDRELLLLKQEYQHQCQLLQQQLSLYSADANPKPLEIVYHDRDFVVINKPEGLLSVPGRYIQSQDSVYGRIKQQLKTDSIFIVHRLDQATSGLLLFALAPESLAYFSKAWQNHQIKKVYEALLPGNVTQTRGTIDLPLAPGRPPCQQVTPQGKPSHTDFFLLSTTPFLSRVELYPHSGRTHQLRVHCLVGLGMPIWGDRLYGCRHNAPRLYLHARELHFSHPRSGIELHLKQPTPF